MLNKINIYNIRFIEIILILGHYFYIINLNKYFLIKAKAYDHIFVEHFNCILLLIHLKLTFYFELIHLSK